ncbi:hypothetical protein [Butyrivibrio sp. YAB3001]|uniref:hypothetical protein n=1 Tax=Butyrivibrio sp. YAB3001 TaxID=1520812 RepID=UPI0011315CC3|nr:hypothetical protein [Butyrivibrio sp. YAB3001]
MSRQALKSLDYGRLLFSRDSRCIYYTYDVFINDISELTDAILDKTITGAALYIAEVYGSDIAEILEADNK